MRRLAAQTALDTSPRGGVRLLPATFWQSGLGDDAPDLLPLRIRDALDRWTHVGFVDPPQDGQCLFHPVVPIEERFGVGRLHHGVDPVSHPAGSCEVTT